MTFVYIEICIQSSQSKRIVKIEVWNDFFLFLKNFMKINAKIFSVCWWLARAAKILLWLGCWERCEGLKIELESEYIIHTLIYTYSSENVCMCMCLHAVVANVFVIKCLILKPNCLDDCIKWFQKRKTEIDAFLDHHHIRI